jgi:hypothetical protein
VSYGVITGGKHAHIDNIFSNYRFLLTKEQVTGGQLFLLEPTGAAYAAYCLTIAYQKVRREGKRKT